MTHLKGTFRQSNDAATVKSCPELKNTVSSKKNQEQSCRLFAEVCVVVRDIICWCGWAAQSMIECLSKHKLFIILLYTFSMSFFSRWMDPSNNTSNAWSILSEQPGKLMWHSNRFSPEEKVLTLSSLLSTHCLIWRHTLSLNANSQSGTDSQANHNPKMPAVLYTS